MTAPASRRALRTLFVIATLVTQTHPCGAQALSASVEGTLASLDPLAKGVVVFLRRVDTMGRATAPTAASIDQRGLQFLPRTVAVTPGSSVSFPNNDPVLHNIFLVDRGRTRIDLGTYPGGELREVRLDSAGLYLVLCHLHPEMVASVLVVDAPYRAVADSAGRFRIDGIPPGVYRLGTWHRRLQSYEETITLEPGGTARVRASLSPGVPRPPARFGIEEPK